MIHMGICQRKYHTLPPTAHMFQPHMHIGTHVYPLVVPPILLLLGAPKFSSHSLSLPTSVCVSLSLSLPCSAWLTTDSSSVSVRWAGPDTFALLCLLSTVGVKDLPSHKAPLLDARMDCTHKCHIQNSHTHKRHAHTQLWK